ncbi:MAG: sulfide-dependent adenosine diphosphate thiazole synthase [bacterium]
MSEESAALFHRASEKDVTRAIVGEFLAQFQDYADSEAVVAGAGPSGLVCAMDLAREGVKVLVVERNNYLGGGFWLGGYLMNKVTVRHPAQEVLDELGVPHREARPGLHVADGPHACAKLIAAACDAGVRFANMTRIDDVVVRQDGRIAGVVVNWTPVEALPRQIACADPVALEATVVVDATGHDAAIAQALALRGSMELPGCAPMWVEGSEDALVQRTGEVRPSLVVAGMAVATCYGLPRMGPTFGAMLLSGRRAAGAALEVLGREAPRPAGAPLENAPV